MKSSLICKYLKCSHFLLPVFKISISVLSVIFASEVPKTLSLHTYATEYSLNSLIELEIVYFNF